MRGGGRTEWPWSGSGGRVRAAATRGWLAGVVLVLCISASLSFAWVNPVRPRPVVTTRVAAGPGGEWQAGRVGASAPPPFWRPLVTGKQLSRRSQALSRVSSTAAEEEFPAVTVRKGFSDFRSDTVTKPTEQMRKAMYKAEVGDDVYREDPTVDQLEREIAAMMGHEAAIFVPSRTMGNLIAIMIWCSARGSSFICGEKSHIFLCEEGGAAQFGGVSPFPIPNEPNGTLDIKKIKEAILDDKEVAQLITLENPVDRCGGRVMPLEYLDTVATLAKEHNMKLHLDGSRIWNAAAHLGVDVKELTCKADSITVCVSKGLGAPAGSLLIGSRGFVEKARKMRKALGGAMRQVGVLAAAGLVALRKSLPRIIDDHEHAKMLARGLATVPGLKVDVAAVETNIVFVDVHERVNVTAAYVVDELQKKGVLALAIGTRRLRMVTHYEVADADVRKAINALDKIMEPYAADLRQAKLEEEAAAAAAASEAAVAAAAAAAVITATSKTPLPAALTDAAAAAAAGVVSATAASEQQAITTPGSEVRAEVSPATSAADSASSSSLVQPGSAVIDTTATTVASQPAPAPNAADEEEAEEVSVLGATTCEEGFALLVSQEPSSTGSPARVLKIVITPCDPMSCGLDVSQAETPEAVTVLQLLQDIDVGSYLRHDALASLVGVKAGHPIMLRRVLVQQTTNGNKRFRARLDVEVAEHNSTATSPVVDESVDLERGQGGGPVPTVAGKIINADVKESFPAIALALRYGAKIWVASRLLKEPGISYDVSDLRSIFPDLLEIKPGGKQTATAVDLDVAYEIGRLEKQLQAAMDEGNEAAQLRIKRQLALYSTSLAEQNLMPPLLEQGAPPPPPPPAASSSSSSSSSAPPPPTPSPPQQPQQPTPELVSADR